MDLQLKGRRAIVCASSRGLGLACATALAREGCEVVVNGRSAEALDAARRRIREGTGADVSAVVADIDTEAGRAALLAACPSPDVLVANNAGPTPKPFAEQTRADWLAGFESTFVAPLALIQAVLPGMRARGYGRIVNIASAMVKSPAPGMVVSTSARIALIAACKAIAADCAPHNVTLNSLLPERFATDRQTFMAERLMKQHGIDREAAVARIVASIPAGRMGRPDEFGDACAYLCSAQAGYVTSQNLQLDGGAYKGVF